MVDNQSHHHRADGRWRIYAFAGPAGGAGAAVLDEWADWLANSPDSSELADFFGDVFIPQHTAHLTKDNA